MSPSSPTRSMRERLIALIREFIQFGLVGASAFVIDMGLFNLFQHGPLGFLAGHVNTANALSATIATIYSWIANRYWTYHGRTQDNVMREGILFTFANVGGVGITQFCLLFTHHILHIHSPLGDNIAAYVVGFALGTAFRFVFYHYIVFTGSTERPAIDGANVTGALGGPIPVLNESDANASSHAAPRPSSESLTRTQSSK